MTAPDFTPLYPILSCAGCTRDTDHRAIGSDPRDRRRMVFECRACCSTQSHLVHAPQPQPFPTPATAIESARETATETLSTPPARVTDSAGVSEVEALRAEVAELRTENLRLRAEEARGTAMIKLREARIDNAIEVLRGRLGTCAGGSNG